jgi:hypothetical protein
MSHGWWNTIRSARTSVVVVGAALLLGVTIANVSASGASSVRTAVPTCFATEHCANLTVDPSGTGSGTATTPSNLINCVWSNGTTSGSCTHEYTWPAKAPAPTITVTYAPTTGSEACISNSCGVVDATVTHAVQLADKGDISVAITFTLAPDKLTVTKTGDGTGVVTSTPAGIACGATCSGQFDGNAITLAAVADAGASFVAWTGACAGQGATCTLTLTGDATTNAVFGLAQPSPTPSPTPTPTPSPSGGPTAAQITLSTSPAAAGTSPTAVIVWGSSVLLTAEVGGAGANRPLQFEVSKDQVTWSTIANVTTDESASASFTYRPSDNRYYRVTFAGAADLGAASSPTVRVVVRSIILLRPTNAGATKQIEHGTAITFTAAARPNRPELPQAHAEFQVYRVSGGTSVKIEDETVAVNRTTGLATLRVTFPSVGTFAVRAQVVPTPVNANSGWTGLEHYRVV